MGGQNDLGKSERRPEFNESFQDTYAQHNAMLAGKGFVCALYSLPPFFARFLTLLFTIRYIPPPLLPVITPTYFVLVTVFF